MKTKDQWVVELDQSDIQEAIRAYMESCGVKTTCPERYVFSFDFFQSREQASCKVTINLKRAGEK